MASERKMLDKLKGRAQELTIPVVGMSCAACADKVEKALKRLPGMQEANV